MRADISMKTITDNIRTAITIKPKITAIIHAILVSNDIGPTLVNNLERIAPYSEIAKIMIPISETDGTGARDSMRPEIIDMMRAATCHPQLGHLNTPLRAVISSPVSLLKM
jgi:hypothetical protein